MVFNYFLNFISKSSASSAFYVGIFVAGLGFNSLSEQLIIRVLKDKLNSC